jgi:NAD+ kinase
VREAGSSPPTGSGGPPPPRTRGGGGREAIGLLFHHKVDRDLADLVAARQFLEGKGFEVWEVPREASPRSLAAHLSRSSLIITLGGDGTLLYGGRLAAPRGIPVLGVNLGRLGFLTELEVHDLVRGLERFIAGDYRIDERTVLQVTVERGSGRALRTLGINEAVVQRDPDGGLIRLRLAVDGQEVGTVDADGALVATATGSTAYALAAGGPILEPSVEDLLLVLMSPFALTVRPIVFPPRQAVTIEIIRSGGLLTVDGGATRRLRDGDRICAAAYDRRLPLVRFGPPGRFYGLLRQKLGWGLPLVPTP